MTFCIVIMHYDVINIITCMYLCTTKEHNKRAHLRELLDSLGLLKRQLHLTTIYVILFTFCLFSEHTYTSKIVHAAKHAAYFGEVCTITCTIMYINVNVQ